MLIGGYVHTRSGVTLGPYANHMLAELKVRRAVLSVAGITEDGYYNGNLLLVETERAMMKAADEVIIVADSTKFDRTSLVHLCGLGEVDVMVVDNEISEEWRAQAGVGGRASGRGGSHAPSRMTDIGIELKGDNGRTMGAALNIDRAAIEQIVRRIVIAAGGGPPVRRPRTSRIWWSASRRGTVI